MNEEKKLETHIQLAERVLSFADSDGLKAASTV